MDTIYEIGVSFEERTSPEVFWGRYGSLLD
jgi:hypothetical protein